MESIEAAKKAFEKVTVVCPECGKKPGNCSMTQLKEGIAKEDISCCSGSGYVMVHEETGIVVDTLYKKANQPGAGAPAYIPLVFDSRAQAGGAKTRTIGWVKETLPGAGASCCAESASCGFFGKLLRCLKFWN